MYRQTVAPYAEPIHLNEAKAQVRAFDASEDSLIVQNIRAARNYIERRTGLQMVAATWKVSADSFYSVNTLDETDFGHGAFGDANLGRWDEVNSVLHVNSPITRINAIELRKCPVASVSSVTYVDMDGATQTLATSAYDTDFQTFPGRITPVFAGFFPAARRVLNSVNITFNAGYVVPFTVNLTTDVFTSQGRTFATGNTVRLTNSGGNLPTPLLPYVDYYVIGASGSTFQLSATSGGSAIDITKSGIGTQFIGSLPDEARQAMLLLVSHFYNNREAVVVTQGGTTAILGLGVEECLQDLRYSLFA